MTEEHDTFPSISSYQPSWDTALVLEPETGEWVEAVMRIRKAYDKPRAIYPVEVTIIGSSGVGCFAPVTDPVTLTEAIGAVTRRVTPFQVPFSGIRSFPGTGIHWLAPEPEPFVRMHEAVVTTGLQFLPIAYPFTPHCTIADIGTTPSDEAAAALARLRVPKERVWFRSAALYQIDTERRPYRICGFPLGG